MRALVRQPATRSPRPPQDRVRPAHSPGYDYAHADLDDESRRGYAERLADEQAATVTAFVERARAFFAEHGIEPKRVMTDDAFS